MRAVRPFREEDDAGRGRSSESCQAFSSVERAIELADERAAHSAPEQGGRIGVTSMIGPPVKLPVRSVPTHAWSVLRGPLPVANFYPGPSETAPPETVSAAVVDHQPEHHL